MTPAQNRADDPPPPKPSPPPFATLLIVAAINHEPLGFESESDPAPSCARVLRAPLRGLAASLGLEGRELAGREIPEALIPRAVLPGLEAFGLGALWRPGPCDRAHAQGPLPWRGSMQLTVSAQRLGLPEPSPAGKSALGLKALQDALPAARDRLRESLERICALAGEAVPGAFSMPLELADLFDPEAGADPFARSLGIVRIPSDLLTELALSRAEGLCAAAFDARAIAEALASAPGAQGAERAARALPRL